jgi:hypothetical protein
MLLQLGVARFSTVTKKVVGVFVRFRAPLRLMMVFKARENGFVLINRYRIRSYRFPITLFTLITSPWL